MAEPLIQRLCAACLRRTLSFARQSGFLTIASVQQNNKVSRGGFSQPQYHRLFTTSLGLHNKTDEFDVTQNPFFEKYQDKLKHLQESNPDEFKSRVSDLKEKKQRPAQPQVEQQTEPLQKPAIPGSEGPRSWPPKSLDEIVNVELLKDLDAAAIDHIWKEHHLSRDCVFSVVPDIEYDVLYAKSKLSPNFLYTLPKGDGFEFYLCQFSGKNVYFTPLGMYQLVKENAPPCLTVAHFDELKTEKGIVLMAGEYDRKVISKAEALNLVKQMTLYYGRDVGHRHNLVRLFNATPDKFQYLDIIEEYKKNRTYLEENPY